MNLSRLCWSFLLCAASLPAAPQQSASQQTRCEDLVHLALPNIVIKSATEIPAGPFHVPTAAPDARPAQLPQFCRVIGYVKPELNFEVWLPARWNRKYLAIGNGGLAGRLVYNGMLDPLRRGYATSSTDTGHSADGIPGAWAEGHMERVVNLWERGVHQMAMAAKLVIHSYYGSAPAHSYFSGCSAGGQQAMTEVQKYPADFDGVIAGDPANWQTRHYTAGHIWIAQAMDGDGYLPAAKIPVLAGAVNLACDALDGIRDGVLNDPRRCHFNPAELECKSGDEPTCLTGAQVEAVRKIWGGLRDADGQRLYPGIEPGGEDGPGGWVAWITGMQPGGGEHSGLGLPVMRYIIFDNPEWNVRSFRFFSAPGTESDLEYVEDKLGRITDAIDPDLRPFRSHGGKLIQYHGWSDPDIPPMNSVNYFESVVHTVGGVRPGALRDTKDFYRLFMVPGMQHCQGGPGPSRFDTLSALEQWVEQDKAPDEMIAAHITNGRTDRTRPLCAYPMEAKYKGSGSTDEAANFTCELP